MTVIGQSTTSHSVNVPGAERPAVLSWGLDTHTGYRRRHNEDSLVAKPPIFAVADGMGGAQAGEVASGLAAAVLNEAAPDGPPTHPWAATTPLLTVCRLLSLRIW